MDQTTAALIEKFAAPVLSGAFGFGGAALRFYLRIRKLEADIKAAGLRLESYALMQTTLGQQMADMVKRVEIIERVEVAKSIETLRSGMRLEINSHRGELEEMLQDIRSTIRSVEDSSHDFAKEAALAQFMSQQQERWEKVQRTLGQIEGFLRREGRRGRDDD